MSVKREKFEKVDLLAEVGREFYRRGWVLGTSGNFSAVVSYQPLCFGAQYLPTQNAPAL